MLTLSGVDSKLRDIKKGRETQNVAQVLRNWYTLPYSFDITPRTFLTTHEAFADKSIVLRSNVQLISYEEEEVKFLELDPTADVLNVRKNPILLVAQLMFTDRVIILPRSIYDEMMEKFVDNRDKKVVWMFHTARCGSTLWAQIFYQLPNWTVFSESQTMFYSVLYARNEVNYQAFSKTKMYESIVLAYIRSYLRLVPDGHSVFWRAHAGLTEHMIPIIHKHFPKHQILFSYRNPIPTAKSFHRLLNALPIWQHRLRQVHADMENEHPTGFSKVMRLFWTTGYNVNVCRQAIKSSGIGPVVFEWSLLQRAARITAIKEHQASGIPIKCVKYEDLVADARSVISSVFDYIGISVDLVEIGQKAMELDSQAGLAFSRENRVRHEDWVRTEEAIRRCNKLHRFFKLPELDEEFTMPDTLT